MRVLNWLEAGYPEGVPPQDRFPLIALLQRRLTDDQTRQIVHDLTSPSALRTRGEGEITQDEIEELIQRHLRESPTSGGRDPRVRPARRGRLAAGRRPGVIAWV